MRPRPLLDPRGPGPVLCGALVFGLALAAWIAVVQPHIPARPRAIHLGVGRDVRLAEDVPPFHASPGLRGAELLILGGSRSRGALPLHELRAAGVRRPAALWRAGAQTVPLLRAARASGTRRLLVSLSPLACYFDRALPPERWDEQREERHGTRRLDHELDRLASSLLALRVPGITTGAWDHAWVHAFDPRASDVEFQRHLRPVTRAARERGLRAVALELRRTVDLGFDVVAVRLPVSPTLRRIEDQAFAPELLAQACRAAGVPYLDHAAAGFETHDGSHLSSVGARGYSRALAGVLRELRPSWYER